MPCWLKATATVEIKAAASLVEIARPLLPTVTSDTSRSDLAISDARSISPDNSTTIKSDPTARLSSVGVPSSTIRPRSIIPTRSANSSASSRYCVVRNTVTPFSRFSLRTSSQTRTLLMGSKPVVGSSKKST